jgi:N-methylhydantoinase A
VTRVAVDIGGTFTDLVYLDGDADGVGLVKVSTTPGSFEQGVVDALREADVEGIDFLAHGTTVVINAITERTGAPTALLTTRGMRDVVEIQKGNRPDLYNLMFSKPEPYVPRRLRFEVSERLDVHGAVVRELDEEDVRRACEQAQGLGAQAVAICFLHSYANPAHELRAAELVREVWPEAAITTSASLSREWREYPRSSTAVLDAYVKPIVANYLGRLATRLDDAGVPRDARYAMRSNGGVSRFEVAAGSPINLVESGPVGGIIGAAAVGRATGRLNVVTLDIGGTTAKSSLITEGAVRVTSDYHVERSPTEAGYPIKVPVVDIVEIGAGGGSIAWLDGAGSLKVGPRSSGAAPGPACYGRGGTAPTLTDANLLAGRIDPDHFLGGAMALDTERAERAFMPIAEALGTSVEATALGVIRIANASMTRLLRLVSVRRGHDPREFALVAFGGGGALHAATLARELHVPEVVIPRAPGHFSALGMLMSDLRHDFVRTHVTGAGVAGADMLAGIWAELEGELVAAFAGERVAAEDITTVRSADMRYAGQEHTVQVELPGGAYDGAASALVHQRFHDAHERLYAFRLDSPLEFVNFRVTGFCGVRQPVFAAVGGDPDASLALKGRRPVHFDDLGRFDSDVYDRDRLGAGATLLGPAVIEETATTTLVLPGMRTQVDATGNLVISTEAAS